MLAIARKTTAERCERIQLGWNGHTGLDKRTKEQQNNGTTEQVNKIPS
jgi:hypothetical protein